MSSAVKPLVVIALLVGGCGGDTSLLLDVGLATGLPQPNRLHLQLFSAGPLGAPPDVPVGAVGHSLPGRLVVQHLDAALPDLRLLVEGLDDANAVMAQAATPLRLQPSAQTHVTVKLDV